MRVLHSRSENFSTDARVLALSVRAAAAAGSHRRAPPSHGVDYNAAVRTDRSDADRSLAHCEKRGVVGGVDLAVDTDNGGRVCLAQSRG